MVFTCLSVVENYDQCCKPYSHKVHPIGRRYHKENPQEYSYCNTVHVMSPSSLAISNQSCLPLLEDVPEREHA